MASLDFFNNFGKVADNTFQKEKTNEKIKPKNTKVIIHHANHVMFTKGEYKGYLGFVYEIDPAYYRVIVSEENSFVFAYQLGKRNVGEIVNGLKIEEYIPKMFAVKLENENEVRLPEESFLRVFVHNEHLVIVNKTENEKCFIKIIKIQPNNDKKILFENLKTIIKNKTLEFSEEQVINCADINSEATFFVIADIPEFGMFGTLQRAIDEQYRVSKTKVVSVKLHNFKKTGKDNGIIKNGPFKGKAKIKEFVKAVYTVYIDTFNKKVKEFSDGTFITDDYLFFMDTLLNNKNYFQVNSENENEYIGVEHTGDTFVNKTIKKSDVYEFQSGFELKYASKNDEKEKELVNMINKFDDTIEEPELGDPDDINEDAEINDYGDVEEQPEQEEQELKHSYKSLQDRTFEQKELDEQEKSMKNSIEKICKFFSINIENTVYNIIDNVKNSINYTKGLLEKDFWKKNDEKYILACILLYFLIKEGYGSNIISSLDFTNKMIEKKFFSPSDIKNSIFLTNDWTTTFTVDPLDIDSFIKKKEYNKLYKKMFENTTLFLKQLFPDMILNYTYTQQDLHIFDKQAYVSHSNYITVNNLLDPTFKIPSNATKILWTKQYNDTITKFKEQIKNANINEDIKNFVYDNLLSTPILLNNADITLLQTPNYIFLQKFYNIFFKHIKAKHAENIKLIQEQQEQKRQEHEAYNKHLKDLQNTNDLSSRFEEMNIDKPGKKSSKIEKIRYNAIKGKAPAEPKMKTIKPKIKIPTMYSVARDTKKWKDSVKANENLNINKIKKEVYKFIDNLNEDDDIVPKNIRAFLSKKFKVDFEESVKRALVKDIINDYLKEPEESVDVEMEEPDKNEITSPMDTSEETIDSSEENTNENKLDYTDIINNFSKVLQEEWIAEDLLKDEEFKKIEQIINKKIEYNTIYKEIDEFFNKSTKSIKSLWENFKKEYIFENSIRKEIRHILDTVDLETFTIGDIRKLLSNKFSVDFNEGDNKKLVSKILKESR